MPESAKPWSKVEIERSNARTTDGRRDVFRSATYLHHVVSGRLNLSSEFGDTSVGPGGLAWAPAGTRITLSFPEPTTHWTLRIRSGAWTAFADGDREAVALMRRIDAYARKRQLLLPVAPAVSEKVAAVLLELEEAAKRPRVLWHRTALKGGAMRLLSALASDSRIARQKPDTTVPEAGGDASRRIAPALKQLNRRDFIIEPGVSVEALAALCGYRPSRFHARFVEVTGTTPIRYLNERRIALACELLGRPHANILEVAFASGYATQSRFYAAFKQIAGCSPGQWRKDRQRDPG